MKYKTKTALVFSVLKIVEITGLALIPYHIGKYMYWNDTLLSYESYTNYEILNHWINGGIISFIGLCLAFIGTIIVVLFTLFNLFLTKLLFKLDKINI